MAIWPYVNALNVYIIRYADVLLWRAEAAIELGDLTTGLKYINQVRKRAMNSQTVKTADGTADAAKYRIGLYPSFSDKEEAIRALRTERRLEFALEGERFFDLVRWGIASDVMNTYFEHEKTFRSHLQNARFIKGTHEYGPIPQAVIDLAKMESSSKTQDINGNAPILLKRNSSYPNIRAGAIYICLYIVSL